MQYNISCAKLMSDNCGSTTVPQQEILATPLYLIHTKTFYRLPSVKTKNCTLNIVYQSAHIQCQYSDTPL